MFGYVRPMKAELKVREFEQFKAVYCGLCHTLKRRYGAFARFALNFDYTFLAMLLSAPGSRVETCYKRCMASPFRKKCCCVWTPALDRAADVSMILLYYKVQDVIADDGFFKRIGARVVSLVFHRKFRKANAYVPSFSKVAAAQMQALRVVEDSGEQRMDAAADPFAALLAGAGALAQDARSQKICTELLYQLGRLIYLLDACDDLSEDVRLGRYNPLRQRFLQSGEQTLRAEAKAELGTTLQCSCGIIAADFELLPPNEYNAILGNIIYLGLPQAVELVLSGKWEARNNKGDKNERSI